MTYADVILPLPLEGVFTYAVPESLRDIIKVGMRAVVPLGKSKTYIAIVAELHDRKPDFDCKPIRTLPDKQPVLLQGQLRLWRWMADYYMSPIGEVYNAALPAGLKEDNYRPRTETYVTLTPKYRSEQALHVAIDMLRRAPLQQKALIDYLALSHYDSLVGDVPQEQLSEVSRDELMNESHCNANVLKNLIDRQILMKYEKEVGRLNLLGEYHPERVQKLNDYQQEAYNQVLFQFLRKNVVLLHGVTSSGKTEIYIHLIEKTLAERRQVLYLLPEIALTVQMTQRLQRIFGGRMGIYHSRYSDAERVEIWQKQLSECPYDIILGARSAVLLPFRNLGLVIVDEEHETSFKQQDPSPRYHARSVAIMLASMAGAKTLLGTATPAVESYYNAEKGKYGLVRLTHRHNDVKMPEIQVVDIQDLQRRKMMNGAFSPQLAAAVRQALARGEQAIIFQNRRGYAPVVECRVCGWVPRCKNCDVTLTLHRTMNVLTCHYCGYTYSMPKQCPCCESQDLRGKGVGTERVEDHVRELFPEARVSRMDLDTTRSRTAYARLINDFSSGRTNLLIGTQMVSKGLDFGKVSVVGILNADTMLNFPDFRAYEHAFMMMTQVSGRAGRKDRQGLVMLQTKNPQLEVVSQVVANDYEGLYRAILEERGTFRYPPFCRIVYVYLKHREERVVESAALWMGSVLRHWFADRVLGPDKPGIARVKTLSIRKIVVKLENGIDLAGARACLRHAHQQILQDKRYAALQVYFDVDPL